MNAHDRAVDRPCMEPFGHRPRCEWSASRQPASGTLDKSGTAIGGLSDVCRCAINPSLRHTCRAVAGHGQHFRMVVVARRELHLALRAS